MSNLLLHKRVFSKHIIFFHRGPAFFIQKQVIAWNDYKVPTTLNEYFDLIERFITANPETKDGVSAGGHEKLFVVLP